MSSFAGRVAFMGAGEIAEVLIFNILNNRIVAPENVFVFDVRPERVEHMKKRFGVSGAGSNVEALRNADYAFSCIRSEYAAELAREISEVNMTGRVVISISSGVPMMLYESKLKNAAIARSLPNPPSKIGEGAIAIAFNDLCSDEQRKDIMSLFSPMGKCFVLRENQIDAVTSITCLAPILSLFQASVEASVLLGIDLKTSQELILQTARGGLKIWEERPERLDEILAQSATPGGITARMLYFLDRERFKYAVKGCIEEGALRTKEFGDRIKENLVDSDFR